MIDVKRFVDVLESAGVDFFTGVPDSLLKSFCAYLTDNCADSHVIAANEGGAVGLAAGHYLATGKPALVYMQNSGQGNAVNPLCSLADQDVYSIPMVLLVGWRGEPGVKDEPQHVKQGKITVPLFETLDIPTEILPDDETAALDLAKNVVERAKLESCPVALIVRKGLFKTYYLKNKKRNISDLKREEAIEIILKALPEDAVVVSTTGMISREVYETRERLGQDHSRDFLTVGSMGHALMIALGIAKAQPDRQVVCIDGDGASIMHMGNMAIAAQSLCGNLTHIVLNNAAHDSVGGQPTVGNDIDLMTVAEALGYDVVHPGLELPIMSPERDRLASSLASTSWSGGHGNVLRFVEVKVSKGARKDLGRPKEPPQVNKDLFMARLKSLTSVK
jgi:phosphonopyruvate decarboxylase